MLIQRVKSPVRSRPYYYVIENTNERPGGKRVLLSLGHTRNPDRAYGEALRDYLRAAARLQQFEMVLPRYRAERAQRG